MTKKILDGGKAKSKLSESKCSALEVYLFGHYHQEFI